MARLHRPRGFSLIESMLAMAIVLVCATGIAKLFDLAFQMNGDARRMTRATAIAEDLLANIQLWQYQNNVAGTPLADASATNDADIADTAFQFQSTADPVGSGLADHGEADITAMGAAWLGIPTAQMGEYQRFWNVTYVDTNGNGVNDLVQIAVIVRWPAAGYRAGSTAVQQWRRVVLLTAKLNPAGS